MEVTHLQASWTLDENIDQSYYDFASMADADNDGQQEVITATSTYRQGANRGDIYVLDCIKSNNKCKDFKERWSFTDDILKKALGGKIP